MRVLLSMYRSRGEVEPIIDDVASIDIVQQPGPEAIHPAPGLDRSGDLVAVPGTDGYDDDHTLLIDRSSVERWAVVVADRPASNPVFRVPSRLHSLHDCFTPLEL